MRYYARKDIGPQTVPFWTGYNASRSTQTGSHSKWTYPPIIESKPADANTIYTAMKQCQSTCRQLGQESTVQTTDQQLYVIAQQVKWACTSEFKNHVVRLGGFHTLCTMISSIGKMWGDAGLLDLLVDSEVYAPNSAMQMLLGKQFNRAVRGLTLAYEALMVILVDSMWVNNESLADTMKQAWNTNEDEQLDLSSTIANELKSHISNNLDKPTFQFWIMFLEAVSIVLMFMRAEREGNWEQHLTSTYHMMAYFFATNKINYARWTPTYLLDMLELPSDVHSAFLQGQFAIRQKDGKFNGTWSDMATEKTIIKDSKSASGIIGLTRKRPAMLRWTLTRHLLGSYSKAFKLRSGDASESGTEHEETRPACLKRDEQDVTKLICHIQQSMTNPFETNSDKLLHLSSGLEACKKVQDTLLSSIVLGQIKFEEFVKGNLDTAGSGSFYQPIKRSGLQTFTDQMKAKPVNGSRKVAMQTEIVFRRALTIARSRNIEMSLLMAHPITHIPPALFQENGLMRTTTKSELLHRLEAEITCTDQLPPSLSDLTNCCTIRDAMSLIQTIPGDTLSTFEDLAKQYTHTLMRCFAISDTVVEVFDQYVGLDSIKASERKKRQALIGMKGIHKQ